MVGLSTQGTLNTQKTQPNRLRQFHLLFVKETPPLRASFQQDVFSRVNHSMQAQDQVPYSTQNKQQKQEKS